MKVRGTKHCVMTKILLVPLLLFWMQASYATNPEDMEWSVEFKETRLSEALKQLDQMTGIHIIIKRNKDDKIFTRKYQKQTFL